MRKVLIQLFEYKYTIRTQIEEIQKQESVNINRQQLEELHKEWDRLEHLIDLFLEGVGV